MSEANNLLPGDASHFKDPEYWSNFYKQRRQTFEWYSEWDAFGFALERYLRPMDKILEVGCGNSRLAEQLYDAGYRRVTSIDIIESVINAQRKRAMATNRETLRFEVMDASKLRFENAQFTVVLDKGTLDALLPSDENLNDTLKTVEKMWLEIERVLCFGGRYLTISLAQLQVLQPWADYFLSKGFIVRAVQLPKAEADFALPVFLLVATKLKPMSTNLKTLEFCNSSNAILKLHSVQSLCSTVRAIQQSLTDECNLILYDSITIENQPRYDLTFIDQNLNCSTGKYAVFIVPQGRQHEWLFANAKGRLELAKQCGFLRLCIVRLRQNQKYGDYEQIKAELGGRVVDFLPLFSCKRGIQIPFLTTDWSNNSILREQGKSEVNGEYFVEDISFCDELGKQCWHRQLKFVTAQNLIQSEARLTDNAKESDKSYLCCQHHVAMMDCCEKLKDQLLKLCIVGLGGGCLATYMHDRLEKANFNTVELDPCMVDVAKKWFSFAESSRLTVSVADGINYLADSAQADGHFDAVILDVANSSYEHGISAPPLAFLGSKCIASIKQLIKNEGVLLLNVVTRDAEKQNAIVNLLATQFLSVWHHSVPDEVNCVLACADWNLSLQQQPTSAAVDATTIQWTLVSSSINSTGAGSAWQNIFDHS